MKRYNWVPLLGDFNIGVDNITFKGRIIDIEGKPSFPSAGIIICDQNFSGGTISADIEFKEISERSTCEIILFYDPETKYQVNAGLGIFSLFNIRGVDEKFQNTNYANIGDKSNLKAGIKYHLEVTQRGSKVILSIDGIQTLITNLPFNIPQSQVGLFCVNDNEIFITNYRVETEQPKVFVVMQFSEQYNELYSEVIKRICSEMNLEAVRADETYGPGLIIAEIEKQIQESKIIIAEISPVNANVYYEVGYSHALKKPTILIAEKSTLLPFDVSPFRTLLYEDSIRGKDKIEEGLRKHLKSILRNY